MTVDLSIEDQVLDRFWRETFDQPLPMAGAGDIVRAILKEQGVSGWRIEAAIRRAKAEQGGPVFTAEMKPAAR